MNGKLNELFQKFDNCSLCKSSQNKLQHILGGGKFKSPKVAFVFINPTHTNISSSPDWNGRRFPFIGVTHFWQILSDSGWVAREKIENIKRHGWGKEIIDHLVEDISNREIYITNLVKCTLPHGDYPEKDVFDYHLPLFDKELRIVKPKAIVSFGGLAAKYLTGKNLVLRKYFLNPGPLVYRHIPVYPCYFPVGRGSPKLASQVLRQLTYLLE